MTALHVACSNGDVEIVQMLLDGKAQVDLADKSHLTPLFLRNNSRRFLSNPNRGGVTGRAGVIAHLGQAKANLDAQDELGRKAIHHQACLSLYQLASSASTGVGPKAARRLQGAESSKKI